jgi:hypothetical protein
VAAVDFQQRLAQLPYLRRCCPPVYRHLQQRPVERERGTQLVRRVRDEPPLAVEGPVEPFQHHVERVSELLHLVVRAVQRDPLVQATVGGRGAGDPGGRLGHPVQRLEQPAGDEPAQRGRRDTREHQRDPALGQQRVQRILPGVPHDLRLELAAGRGPGTRARWRLRRSLEAGEPLATLRDPLGDQRVGDTEQQHAGDQEEPAVDERQAGADGQPGPAEAFHGLSLFMGRGTPLPGR